MCRHNCMTLAMPCKGTSQGQYDLGLAVYCGCVMTDAGTSVYTQVSQHHSRQPDIHYCWPSLARFL